MPLQATYEGTEIPNSGNNIALSNGSTMVFSNVTNINDVVLIGSENSRHREWKPSDLGTVTGLTLNIDKLLAGNEYILFSMYKKGMVDLNQSELESLDTLRDNILTTKGNVTFSVTGIDSVPVLQQFNERFGKRTYRDWETDRKSVV